MKFNSHCGSERTDTDGALPLAAKLVMEPCCSTVTNRRKLNSFRIFVLLVTYVAYMGYYISRKPISVVKNQLINCTITVVSEDMEESNCSSFISEIDGTSETHAKTLLGILDTSFLFSYAIFMFLSGVIAERMDLRYFLSSGLLLSGFLSMLFGLAFYWDIHSIAWFIIVQIMSGAAQSTGWPAVVTIVTNWFGKGKKGLFFGIWYSHTSVGNIIGSLLAGVFVEDSWGLSFIIPGVVTAIVGVFCFLVLIPHPKHLLMDLDSVSQSSREEEKQRADNNISNKVEGSSDAEGKAISPLAALKLPGVIEYSLCLFFAKLVSYTFLYWLPTFIMDSDTDITPESAAYLSTLFDVGGIVGAILAGLAVDVSGNSAITCAVMLVLAIPTLFSYNTWGSTSQSVNMGLLLLLGLLVNGPSSLIATAISADLGTQLKGPSSSSALATVTGIINSCGSVGAAVGPLLAGIVPDYVFYMLMLSDILALLFLTRPVVREGKSVLENLRQRWGRCRKRTPSIVRV